MSISDHLLPVSAHRAYWENHNNPYIYEYDPTDDGPECHTISWINSTHTQTDIENEREAFLRVLRGAQIINRIADSLTDALVYELFRRQMVRKGLL
jgi:hypothetical protein